MDKRPSYRSDMELPKTRQELVDLRLAVQREYDEIKSTITDAKRRAWEGDYSDIGWLRRAEDSLKHHSRLIARIQNELTKLKGSRPTSQFETYFVDEARRLLPHYWFEHVFNHASGLMKPKEE